MWKKKVILAVWMLAGIGLIVLLGAAMQTKNRKVCADVKIEITGAEQHMFIDEQDVLQILNEPSAVVGREIANIELRKLEEKIEQNPWVKNAELFFNNTQNNAQVLMVLIEERQPVARVFANNGSSFYIDTAFNLLPLSEKLTARVPVFTGFNGSKEKMLGVDSTVLKDVVKIGAYILADSFWQAQVAQMVITPNRTFELIPVVGNHTVMLGTADDLERKMDRLFTFYKQAWLQNGMNKYEKLDVQFNNQVVAVRRGSQAVGIDSAIAAMAVQAVVAEANADSVHTMSTRQVNNIVARDTMKRVAPVPVRTTNSAVMPPKPRTAARTGAAKGNGVNNNRTTQLRNNNTRNN